MEALSFNVPIFDMTISRHLIDISDWLHLITVIQTSETVLINYNYFVFFCCI